MCSLIWYKNLSIWTHRVYPLESKRSKIQFFKKILSKVGQRNFFPCYDQWKSCSSWNLALNEKKFCQKIFFLSKDRAKMSFLQKNRFLQRKSLFYKSRDGNDRAKRLFGSCLLYKSVVKNSSSQLKTHFPKFNYKNG